MAMVITMSGLRDSHQLEKLFAFLVLPTQVSMVGVLGGAAGGLDFMTMFMSAATRRILALQKGPTVLVGHSIAGTEEGARYLASKISQGSGLLNK
jgi:hypothetical protein